MDFIRSWKFMAIIVAVLSVLAIVGVIIGVTTHTETGFDPAHSFIPDEVSRGYTTVPVGVCASSYAADVSDTWHRAHGVPEGGNAWTEATTEDHDAVASAVSVLNERVGFDLLRMGDCAIHINVGVPVDPSWENEPGGRAWRCHDSCCIETANTGTPEMLALALQHELGHCLGLGHDDFAGSIMSTRLAPTPDGEFPPRITDSDRELLRQHYSH